MPRGHRISGGRLRDTEAQTASKRLRAVMTQCPHCQRKAALVTERDDWGDGDGMTITYCRWKAQGKCDYHVARRWQQPAPAAGEV